MWPWIHLVRVFSQFLSHSLHTLLAGCVFIPLAFILPCFSSLLLYLCDPPTSVFYQLNYIMQCRTGLLPHILFILVLILTLLSVTVLPFGTSFSLSQVLLPVAGCLLRVNLGHARGHPVPAGDTEHLPPLPTDFELCWQRHQCRNTTWHNNYYS